VISIVIWKKNYSLNRIGTQQELDLVKTLKAKNITCDLVDTYRIRETEEGYTWSNKLVQTKVDWCFDKSDQAALWSYFLFYLESVRGIGIPKLNVKLLDDKNYCEQIKQNLVEMLVQIPSTRNPHTKLEFTKVAICTAFSCIAKSAHKVKIVETEEID